MLLVWTSTFDLRRARAKDCVLSAINASLKPASVFPVALDSQLIGGEMQMHGSRQRKHLHKVEKTMTVQGGGKS